MKAAFGIVICWAKLGLDVERNVHFISFLIVHLLVSSTFEKELERKPHKEG
jgi:hypothetical protein